MKLRKIITSALAAALLVTTVTACDNSAGSGNSGSTESSKSEGSSSVESSSGSSSESSTESTPENVPAPDVINVAALKGPTAMGMTKLMNDDEESDLGYEFNIYAAPDEITPLVAQGKLDIACVPANLGSVLYNKTEGGVQALAVNTLGVLYILENGDTVKSAADLKGKTIFASGKGATPEYSLNFILKENGIDPEKDVTIEWKNEHAECLQSLLSTENSVALLPQPFVTTALKQNEGIRVALDLNDEWDNTGADSSLLTGIVIVRKAFAEQYPDAVNQFLDRYADSVGYVNNNVEEAAQLIEKYDIVKAAVAKDAIPACHIVCVRGDDMKDALSGYLQVLFDADPQSVGGKLPADDFYFE